MKSWAPVLANILLLAARDSISAQQCTTANGATAPYATVRLALVNPNSMPAAVRQGIEDAVSAWNSPSCNDGNDFPILSTTGGADESIPVIFEPGISAVEDGDGNSVCAMMNPGSATDGSDSTISLFGTIRLANGQTHACYPDRDIAGDSVAHELGHYFGMGESSCPGHIMYVRSYIVINGELSWDTVREVQGDECEFVDAANTTSAEERAENDDPWCNAYCWTQCIGNYCPEGAPSCPILMDTENDGIHLTGLEDPVWFDIDADGDLDLISWTDRSEGILAFDRNGNGMIDDGGELFGNATRLADGSRAPNGYVALAELDDWAFGGNRDEVIDADDEVFSSLWLWTDLNHEGTSQPEELQTLAEAGIVRIGLDYRMSRRTDRHGNEFRFLGKAWKEGRWGVVRPLLTWDVFFVVAP